MPRQRKARSPGDLVVDVRPGAVAQQRLDEPAALDARGEDLGEDAVDGDALVRPHTHGADLMPHPRDSESGAIVLTPKSV